VIGDSIIATYNSYDQLIYAIGKGPSKTTVNVQNNVLTAGGSILVEGTVTDVSPGTKSAAQSLRFPNGVAAVSDASQSGWMKYVYMQFAKPMDTAGVNVVLNVVDANGNYREIGRTTSDANGYFSYLWQPDISGKYNVFATFEGSASYYPSSSETSFVVMDAPSSTPTSTSLSSTMPQELPMYLAAGFIAIIIAIVIVGILILKKK
jgi:hypothetical protein